MSQALTVIADRYRVSRTLGTGGAATVVLAEDELLRRPVAVKLLHPHGDESMARRLLREAKIGASLSHPNLVMVFDTILHETELVVVMEYVEGETLAQALNREGALEPRRAIEILRAVAAALDHAHGHGIVHRDVKPGNILLGTNGVVKLADLGIAYSADASRITQTGTALGSVAYMAPEQLKGERSTPATDVYGLAAVAFEMLGGRSAHGGANPMDVIDEVTNEPAPDLREAWPLAPAAAAELLRRAMDRDPAQRPAGAGGFVDELAEALEETRRVEPVAPPEPEEPPTVVAAPALPPPPPPPARRRPVAAHASPGRASSSALMPGRSADASRTLPRQRRGHSGRRLAALLGLLALLLVGGGLASLVLRDDNSDGGGSGTQAQSGGAQGEARSDASDEAPAGADSAAEGDGQPSGEGAGAAPGAPDGGDDGDGAVAGEQATGDSGQGAGAPAAPNAGAATAAGAESVTNPIGAIRAFYGRAARQDAVGVCALRGPRLQVRFTCAELTAQFARLRSVTFDRLELESEDDRTAVVAIATRAVHDGFTDRCRGTIQLVRGGADEWLVDGLDVTCKRN